MKRVSFALLGLQLFIPGAVIAVLGSNPWIKYLGFFLMAAGLVLASIHPPSNVLPFRRRRH